MFIDHKNLLIFLLIEIVSYLKDGVNVGLFKVFFSFFQAIMPFQVTNVLVVVWFGGFYGISTFIGYLMPNPLSCK